MIRIVQPDGDEIADVADACSKPRIAFDERQLLDGLLADFGEALGRQRLAGQVGDEQDRSRMRPFSSRIPGFSRPRGPKRTSFIAKSFRFAMKTGVAPLGAETAGFGTLP